MANSRTDAVPTLIEPKIKFHEGDSENRKLVIESTQEIPASFLDACGDYRLASVNAPCGNFMKVASIPTGVVEKWLREGFDIQKEPIRATVARLKAEDLSAFLTTSKRI